MSEKVTFQELIDSIAEQTDNSKKFTHDFLKDLVSVINTGLDEDGKVNIAGFGKFELRRMKEREGYNPQTGNKMTIPSHNKVVFKPYKDLRELVNAPYAHLEPEIIEEETEETEPAAESREEQQETSAEQEAPPFEIAGFKADDDETSPAHDEETGEEEPQVRDEESKDVVEYRESEQADEGSGEDAAEPDKTPTVLDRYLAETELEEEGEEEPQEDAGRHGEESDERNPEQEERAREVPEESAGSDLEGTEEVAEVDEDHSEAKPEPGMFTEREEPDMEAEEETAGPEVSAIERSEETPVEEIGDEGTPDLRGTGIEEEAAGSLPEGTEAAEQSIEREMEPPFADEEVEGDETATKPAYPLTLSKRRSVPPSFWYAAAAILLILILGLWYFIPGGGASQSPSLTANQPGPVVEEPGTSEPQQQDMQADEPAASGIPDDGQDQATEPEPEQGQGQGQEQSAAEGTGETQASVSETETPSTEISNPSGGSRSQDDPQEVTINRGQSLWSIARNNYQDPYLWPWIYDANKNTIRNPNLIVEGQTLAIPVPDEPNYGLSDADSLEVAIGYVTTYHWYKQNGDESAKFYLWAARIYDQNVFDYISQPIDEEDLAFANRVR